jgi:excisionase family DNA binding protein
VGAWSFDLESLDVDWLRQPDGPRPKVAYSQETVALFDRAAQIAKSAGDRATGVNHLLAAFASEEAGLMGKLKGEHGITNASWRAAVARIGRKEYAPATPPTTSDSRSSMREYLTPEEAAEVLGIHVQTMRSYIRTARIPAFRMAGERAIRIRRVDLEKVLEPLESGTSKE